MAGGRRYQVLCIFFVADNPSDLESRFQLRIFLNNLLFLLLQVYLFRTSALKHDPGLVVVGGRARAQVFVRKAKESLFCQVFL